MGLSASLIERLTSELPEVQILDSGGTQLVAHRSASEVVKWLRESGHRIVGFEGLWERDGSLVLSGHHIASFDRVARPTVIESIIAEWTGEVDWLDFVVDEPAESTTDRRGPD